MKQVHKYNVGDKLWYGRCFAKVLKRLDNQMYQIKYEDWKHGNIVVVSENHLSLTRKSKVTNYFYEKVSIKRKNDRELISKRIRD